MVGAIQITAGIALPADNTYGRVIVYAGAGRRPIGSVLASAGPHPWWSLAFFALCIYIIHGLCSLEVDERTPAG